jgi:hypothetical protein
LQDLERFVGLVHLEKFLMFTDEVLARMPRGMEKNGLNIFGLCEENMDKETFYSALRIKGRVCLKMFCGLLMIGTLSACTGDRYQQQADVIKGHVKMFYDHLQSHQVDQARFDNEQIEVVAIRSEERLLRRVGQMRQGERMQEWRIIKTAKETAAENWLALGRYFSEFQQYHNALGAYRRIIETYQGSAYQLYVDRAEMGLRNVEDILNSRISPVDAAN